MNDQDQNKTNFTPEERVAYLESLQLVEESAPWTDNSLVFFRHLDDEHPQVRIAAIKGLWHVPTLTLLDRLIQIAEQDPSPQVRAQAISGLGIFIFEGVMADFDSDWELLDEMRGEDEIDLAGFERAKAFLLRVYAEETRTLDERRYAIESLGFEWDPAVADLIQEAYEQPERMMKISALFAMGRSGLARWRDILKRELYNEDLDIRREAIRAVGGIGMDELGKDLYRLTYDENREIMLEAIEALGQTGWREGFDRLEELTGDLDPEVAQVAEEALDEWLLMEELGRESGDLDLDDLIGFDEDWGDGGPFD